MYIVPSPDSGRATANITIFLSRSLSCIAYSQMYDKRMGGHENAGRGAGGRDGRKMIGSERLEPP